MKEYNSNFGLTAHTCCESTTKLTGLKWANFSINLFHNDWLFEHFEWTVTLIECFEIVNTSIQETFKKYILIKKKTMMNYIVGHEIGKMMWNVGKCKI